VTLSLALRTVGAPFTVVGAGLAGMCVAGLMFDGGGTPAPCEALAFASWPIAAWALVMWFVFHTFVALDEEPTLHRMFGASDDDYRRHVPRWSPR